MNQKSVAKAILEAVDDKERDDVDGDEERDELDMAGPSDIDKVVPKEPAEDPPFAPDANMMIKDQAREPTLNEPGEIPTEPGMIDPGRVAAAAERVGLNPVDMGGMDMLVLYDGAKHELEHTGDFDLAAAIAAGHLAKHPRYYELLPAFEDRLGDRKTREPYHSLDMHDGPGEGDGYLGEI